MRTRLLSLMALLVGVLLAGCGGTSGDSGYSGEPDASTTVSVTGGPIVSPSGKPPVASGQGITITGTPIEGVEDGCIVMQSGDKLYLLLGGDVSVLMSGRPVAVTGTPNPGLMTTCQQGTPFQVTAVRPA
jgi:hypothetical protein